MSDQVMQLLGAASRIDIAFRAEANRTVEDPILAHELRAAGAVIEAAHLRVRAQMLRSEKATPVEVCDLSTLECGPLTVDRRARSVTIGAKRVILSKKEYELLCVLASEPTRTWTKEELYRMVWGVGFTRAGSRTLDSVACRLRKSLGESWVRNRWGVGYSLVIS